VPPGDEAGLATAIGRLLADPAEATGLGHAARRRVEVKYSRAAMVERFQRFFEEMAGRQP
jgi:glycosyltransferase involved in cell wall biosynthesis